VRPTIAAAAKSTHIVCAYVLVLTLAGHVVLVLWHTLVLEDGLVRRIAP
jgi:cytochrome b561